MSGADLTQPATEGMRTVEQNPSRREPLKAKGLPVPFGSKVMRCPHLPPGARTRWVTERIASLMRRGSAISVRINQRNDRFEL